MMLGSLLLSPQNSSQLTVGCCCCSCRHFLLGGGRNRHGLAAWYLTQSDTLPPSAFMPFSPLSPQLHTATGPTKPSLLYRITILIAIHTLASHPPSFTKIPLVVLRLAIDTSA